LIGATTNCAIVELLMLETFSVKVERIGACTRDAEIKFVEPVNCVGTARPLIEETWSEERVANLPVILETPIEEVVRSPVICVLPARLIFVVVVAWIVRLEPVSVPTDPAGR
jgi:hypothetical protein